MIDLLKHGENGQDCDLAEGKRFLRELHTDGEMSLPILNHVRSKLRTFERVNVFVLKEEHLTVSGHATPEKKYLPRRLVLSMSRSSTFRGTFSRVTNLLRLRFRPRHRSFTRNTTK